MPPDDRCRTSSFKLDSGQVPDLPAAAPAVRDLRVSPRVEGVHLRAGFVARGGIRWSDRREDFRTEILGLMKAQTVKNAVIVPVGAKGGFVVQAAAAPTATRSRPRWRPATACSSRDCSTSPTTSWAARSVRPERVVVYDDAPDAYLVVAADKGTATFSDVANEIAAGPRLLARRRVRVRRFDGLRPQGDGYHRPRRVGVRPPPLPRARRRRRHRADHGRRHRRHVG